MNKIVEYLNNNKIGQFATIKDGQISMRPFHFVFEKDGKFIFGTANNKAVYQELVTNKTAAFGVMGQDGKWLRLRGKVEFIKDIEIKKEMFDNEPLLSSVYKTPDNPIFEAFYLYDGEASLHGGMGSVAEVMAI